ncbi:MAG: hypothetical protein MUC68_15635, partial [Burkholderiaceae bacterium]|nr:hypothetical protein [Burkholderiaceae bacterium]
MTRLPRMKANSPAEAGLFRFCHPSRGITAGPGAVSPRSSGCAALPRSVHLGGARGDGDALERNHRQFVVRRGA